MLNVARRILYLDRRVVERELCQLFALLRNRQNRVRVPAGRTVCRWHSGTHCSLRNRTVPTVTLVAVPYGANTLAADPAVPRPKASRLQPLRARKPAWLQVPLVPVPILIGLKGVIDLAQG